MTVNRCKVCKKTFAYPSVLNRHIINNHSAKHKCSSCSDVFDTHNLLRTHIKSAHPKVYSCQVEYCTFESGEKSFLNRHYKKVHGEKAVVCSVDDCNFMGNFWVLKRHINEVHINAVARLKNIPVLSDKENSVQSSKSDDSYSENLDSAAMLSCQLCGKKMVTQLKLKRHYARVHERRYKERPREKQFICNINGCSKSFTTPGKLQDHLNVHKAFIVDCIEESAIMAAVGDANAPSLDVQQALKRVVRSSHVVGGLSRGLHESAKVLDKREAVLCLYAEECDEENYQKLVRALCKVGEIPLYTLETKAELGELVGQCKYDKEGKARKVVGCSCAVIKDWGRDEEARNILLEYLKK